eukprot:126279_1
MMLSFFLSVTILYIFDYSTNGYSLDCKKSPKMCFETTIECTENEDCVIACNTPQSCMSSTISCPINGDCNIECDGWQACRNITINSKHSESGNLIISCNGIKNNSSSTDHCNGMKIFGSSIETYSGTLNVLCNGEIQSCMKSYIKCPIHGDCFISCNADKSCKLSNIIGPTNGDLIVNCNAERSCLGSIFNGVQSNHMDINGCTAMESCLDLSLYCPPNINRTANCFMQGNNNIGSLEIYAINGWSDIQIDFSGDNYGGIMHCGNTYDIECNIVSDNWKCVNDICNFNNFISTVETLPDLTNDFEHGSMGMVLIGGGLILIAIGCIICGVLKHFITKWRHKSVMKKQKTKHKSNKKKEINTTRHIQAIIGGEEPSYEDSNGVIHHQHNYHERKLSSLHDRERLKRI